MAAGQGWVYRVVHYHHSNESHPAEIIIRQIYWARYVDWAITTPLVLLDLTVLAGLPGAEIILAVFADVAMILFVSLPNSFLRLELIISGSIGGVYTS